MLIRKPFAIAFAALSFAGAGNAAAGQWFVFGSTGSFPPVDGSQTETVGVRPPAQSVFRQSTAQWFVFGSSTGSFPPVDGSQTETVGVQPLAQSGHRKATGEWLIRRSTDGSLAVGGSQTETVGVQPPAQSGHRNEIHVESFSWGQSSAAAAGELAASLQSTPGGEHYLAIKLENAIISQYQTGGSAKPPTEGGPRMLSAGEGGATAAFNGFSNFGDIKGESTDARGVGRVAPLQQLPSPVAPQRSPIAAGPSKTLVVGEKFPRPVPAFAAPSGRR